MRKEIKECIDSIETNLKQIRELFGYYNLETYRLNILVIEIKNQAILLKELTDKYY